MRVRCFCNMLPALRCRENQPPPWCREQGTPPAPHSLSLSTDTHTINIPGDGMSMKTKSEV